MRVASSLLPLAAATLALSRDLEQVPLPTSGYKQLEANAIPLLGFGTWRLQENCSVAVSWAIQTGYTHIDCAAAYGNEEEVGRGIRDGLEKSGKTRDDLWITSKLWNDQYVHIYPNCNCR